MRNKQHNSVVKKLLTLCCLFSLEIKRSKAQNSTYDYTGPSECTTDSSVLGYNDILTLNEDMVYEAYTAFFSEEAKDLKAEYIYKLCPFTTFDMDSSDLSKTIMPLLNNTQVLCGNEGKSSSKCLMKGGQIHAIFGQGLLIDNVVFAGLTFEKSYGVSIGAWAYPSSFATFSDCHWKDNTATTLVEMYFNPNERRRALEGEEYKGDESLISPLYDNYASLLATSFSFTADRYSLLMDMAQRNELLTSSIDYRSSERELQGYPSMSIDFTDCTFKDNTLVQAVILDGGGRLKLSQSKFERNEVGVFLVGALYGSQLFIQDQNSFLNNTSLLFTVYVDSNSFLELNSDTSFGEGSYSPACADGIFLENDNSYCLYQGGTCHGICCAFGNSTCDNLLTADEIAAVVTAIPKAAITIVGPTNQDTTVVNEITDAMQGAPSNSEQIESNGGCNGTCIGLAVFIPILVMAIAVLGVLYYKKKKATNDVPYLGNEVQTPIS